MEGTLAIIGIFSSLIFLVYLFFTTRHKERMSLIDSGRDADIFYGKPLPKRYAALKWGLLLVFLGLGAAIGIYIDFHYENDGPIATFPSIFIAGGLGLLVYYFLVKNDTDKDLD